MSDKTVLITGCSSGIGRATAESFLEDSWTVYATSRDEDDITDLRELGCVTAPLDVTEQADVNQVVDRIDAEEGGVDCLVNNAGYGQYGPIEDVTADRLQRQFEVNVYGPHRVTRAVLPNMRRQESGTIVNVSSIYGQLSTPGAGPYAGSKHALEAMSDALRAEVDGLGIDVVVVVPGAVDTKFTARAEREIDSLEGTREYEWVYDAFEDTTVTTSSLPFASDPTAVATTIHDAACMSDPDPRYPVGTFTRYALRTRFLPDRLQDLGFRVVRKLF
jgi:NAD(P)-dependent dehydrogenase (short-subunit alcohol dehydrogenase family)